MPLYLIILEGPSDALALETPVKQSFDWLRVGPATWAILTHETTADSVAARLKSTGAVVKKMLVSECGLNVGGDVPPRLVEWLKTHKAMR